MTVIFRELRLFDRRAQRAVMRVAGQVNRWAGRLVGWWAGGLVGWCAGLPAGVPAGVLVGLRAGPARDK